MLLPVEEGVDDAKVDVLLDGKPETTIYVRLARNKVDYYVPFDLSRYKDSDILLNVVTAQGRSSVREAKEDACWKTIRLSDTFDTTNTEKYRPAFHHTPLYGWMNDPNGMFYKDGVWHLYYQYNPYGSKWQNMTWAHSTSTDLVNWEHQPLAIEPNGLGSVFSGSCIVDKANTAGFGKDEIIALYTSAGINQMQSLAHSSDNGQTFDIYPGNPVITLESEARDPNMFWNEETKEWNLLLAHALDHEMLIFTSPDLKTWTLQSSFGKGLGAQDGVWECPDLFQLPVNGTSEKKWVLICNLNPGGVFGGSATQYFVGDFDGKTFTVDTPASGTVPTKWMDFGKDHYATVSWSDAPDDRRVVIGWMSNWQYAAEVPTKQFRSANTLPRDISLFRGDDGEYYISTLPSPEVNALRDKKVTAVKSKSIGKNPLKYPLPTANDGICEIDLTVTATKNTPVSITLSNAKGEHCDMVFNPADCTFSFDRTESGLTDFSQDFPAKVSAPTLRNSNSQSIRIFVDRSSIEVFDTDGNFVMTNLVFPTEAYSTVSLAADGGKATLNSMEIYSLNPSK
ncbi:MAG: GH32 C-terminal domain-containing protein [Duncaniella sp.]|nr:GH32 C-terminal domain-containing protein [Duncaniella sp.]